LNETSLRYFSSISVTIFAIALWIYSILNAKLIIGFYGFIHSLPVFFFISLILLTFASALLWNLDKNCENILFLQLCLLISELWLTPILLGASHPGRLWTYHLLSSFVDSILSHGFIKPETLWYHNWPGSWIFYAIIYLILGLNFPSHELILIYPFLFQFAIMLPLYSLLRNIIEEPNSRWIAMWLIYLANWIGQDNILAQSFAYLLFLMIILSLTILRKYEFKRTSQSFLTILLFATLVISHLLTSIVTYFIFLVLYIMKKLRRHTLVTISVIIIAWTIYGSYYQFNLHFPAFLEKAFKIDIIFEKMIFKRITETSAPHSAVNIIRSFTALLFVIISLLGFLKEVTARKKWPINKNDMFVIWMLEGIFITLVLVGPSYGFETPQRIYIFSLIPIGFFGKKLLNSKATRIVMLIFLIIALPLHVISHYGNQIIDYASPGYLAGSFFFSEKSHGGSVLASYGSIIPFSFSFYERHDYFLLDNLYEEERVEGKKNLSISEFLKVKNQINPLYVCISDYDKKFYYYEYNDTTFAEKSDDFLQKSKSFNFIYNNGITHLYFY